MGLGIERLAHAIDNVFTGSPRITPQPTFQGLDQREAFYNSYPAFGERTTSASALFLKCHGIGVMFTGDLEKAGFAELLKRQDFSDALRATHVYAADPTHGREKTDARMQSLPC